MVNCSFSHLIRALFVVFDVLFVDGRSNVIPEHMGSPLGAVSTETPAPMKSEPQVEEADTDKAANANEDTMSDELDTKHNDPDDDDDDDDNSENVEGDEEKSTSTPVKDDIYTAVT